MKELYITYGNRNFSALVDRLVVGVGQVVWIGRADRSRVIVFVGCVAIAGVEHPVSTWRMYILFFIGIIGLFQRTAVSYYSKFLSMFIGKL